MGVDELLKGNEEFLKHDYADNIEYYNSLVSGQHPHTMVISCCDSRVVPEIMCNAKPGEIFVHRNIGNIVPSGDFNVGTYLEYGINHLHVTTLVVCGHEECGAMNALAHSHGGNDSFIPGWLGSAHEALEICNTKGKCPEDPKKRKVWQTELEIENVRVQLRHLRSYKCVTDAESAGKIKIVGLYYRISSGKVEIVNI